MFSKKEKSIENLIKSCNEEHKVFLLHLGQAHTQSYFEFKVCLKEDFNYIKTKIEDCMDLPQEAPRTKTLLQHFEKQLKFINKNCFLASKEDFDKFIKDNYPYREKVLELCNAFEKSTSNTLKKNN